MGFSKAQSDAIAHKDGPALILAGPGSGKTTVITYRIKKLITDYQISGSSILVITFTKAAANEMRSRFIQMMGGNANGVCFGTFHSVFYRILRFAYNYDASNIISEKEQYTILEEIMEKRLQDIPDYRELASGLLSEISSIKNNGIDIEHYYSKSCSETAFRNIFHDYEDALRALKKVDFDDILTITYDLLKNRSDILALWQSKFKYILIDEFQDINFVQYNIVKLLAKPANNLFIVGDDDQSVYRFRGARPEIMLGFKRDYPDAVSILLDINYRSDAYIVAAASNLIAHNRTRFKKEFKASHDSVNPVLLKRCSDIGEENKYLITEIKQYIDSGYKYTDIAILFRTNLGARLVMDTLMKSGIPFSMKDSVPNLFTHWIALDIITYLRLACTGSDKRADWIRIMNRPNRYIKREALGICSAKITIRDLKRYYKDKEWMLERLDRLEYDINIMKKMSPYAAVHYLGNAMKYKEYLADYAKEHHIKENELYDIFSAVHESCRTFKTFDEWMKYVDDYSEELKKQTDKRNEAPEGVCLCTLHCAKGLEYPIVFIPDINEDNIPHARAALDTDIEEERRLFYVGMTRAKQHLHLCCTAETSNHQKAPSRFLCELNSPRGKLSV